MQDSFESRMQGQTPENIKPKKNTALIIVIAVLAVATIALGVVAFLANQDSAKKDERITNLEKQIEELNKQKEEESKTEEEAPATDSDEESDDEGEIDSLEKVQTELDAYIKSTKMTNPSYSYTYKINSLKLTNDKKYYYAHITVSVKGGSNDSSVEYRAAKDGKWGYVNGGNGIILCSEIDSDSLDFIKTYGKEFKYFAVCVDENGVTRDYSK